MPYAFAGKAIPIAALLIDFDLPPNVLMESQQTFVLRLGNNSSPTPETMAGIFNFSTAARLVGVGVG
jgi:hypothetical protein